MRIILFFIFIVGSNSTFAQGDETSLNFHFLFNGDSLQENKWYITQKGDSVRFETIKFFVSIPPSGEVSSENVHLVDWLNSETHTWQIPLNDKDELIFTWGLDPMYHTSNILDGDLDPSLGLYWAWQSGYIQFKIEGESPSAKTRNNKFQYHLGGYLDPFSVSKTTNYGTVHDNNIPVEFDLSKALEKIKIKEQNQVMIPGKAAMKLMNKFIAANSVYGAY